MKLYDNNGYLNVPELLKQPEPFIFVHGGRAVGKTYGALRASLDGGHKFIYSRRLQTELDVINKPEYMPFKALMADDPELHVGVAPISKYNAAFYRQQEASDGWVNAGSPIGYTAALSTFANIRGFDASDVDLWIYDEFIPEAHVRPIKQEGTAFLNAYETINRNRELKGKQPVKVLALANSNRLANPVYIELDLVKMAEKMKQKGMNVYRDSQRGVLMVDPFDSPIGEAKADTALYKLANKRSEFYGMAIGNEFDDLAQAATRSRPLQEYRPMVTIGDLTVYRHKGDGSFYVSKHRTGSPPRFAASGKELLQFRRDYAVLWRRYMQNLITFEDYGAEALFNAYFID